MNRKVLIWGDLAFWLAVLVAAILRGPRTTAWVAGIALAAFSFPLWIVARIQLGTAFSIMPRARGLVTSGLYARMRHRRGLRRRVPAIPGADLVLSGSTECDRAMRSCS